MATANETKAPQNLASRTFVAAWVDQSIDDRGPNQAIKNQFEPLSPLIDRWLYFNNADNFATYLQGNGDVRLIAVMTGGMARELVPRHSNSNVLESVYIFCFDIGRAREAVGNEPKVKGIFNIEDALYEKMADDLATSFVQTGVALAQLDQRNEARAYYQEAKRLLSLPMNHVKDDEKRRRLEELDARLDQLIA